MKLNNILITLSFVLTLCVTISYSLEELLERPVSDHSSNVRLSRVKRKGGRGGGGRGGSRGSSRGSSKSKSRVPPSDPYPKQPAYNPNYGAGGAAPAPGWKQPGQHANYPGQQQSYPGQTGHNYPGQTGQGYPQAGYGQNYGKTGGLGGIGTGMGGNYGKSKSGLGGLGTGLAGGAIGAAVGAYGGYQLGKMVGGLGRSGHYGYYNDRYQYVRCDPPPKIETDPATNITYIPKTITYDARCDYYDKEPPRTHPYYNQRGYYMSGSQTSTSPNVVNTLMIILSVFVFCFDYRFISTVFRPNFLPQI